MVEVVLTNLQRIDQLWPIFLSHIIQLLGHAKTSIRNAATDALGKAVVGALSHVNALKDSSNKVYVTAAHNPLTNIQSHCVIHISMMHLMFCIISYRLRRLDRASTIVRCAHSGVVSPSFDTATRLCQ